MHASCTILRKVYTAAVSRELCKFSRGEDHRDPRLHHKYVAPPFACTDPLPLRWEIIELSPFLPRFRTTVSLLERRLLADYDSIDGGEDHVLRKRGNNSV